MSSSGLIAAQRFVTFLFVSVPPVSSREAG